jgi:ADP-heptose:LPS heptosyltransferase
MNLRIRDNALYGIHRGLAGLGVVKSPTLDEIRKKPFQRVLIVATTAIGDALLCTPLLDSLRQARPDAHIGFWVSAGACNLFKNHPSIDSLIPYFGKYRRVRETLDQLRMADFDLALVANANDPDVIPMIWWSGCRRIIRRPQRFTIYHFMVANPEMLNRNHTSGHAIERNLEFCDLLHLPRGESRTSLSLSSELKDQVIQKAQKSKPWLVIHPGSSRSKKQWGASNYVKLALKILESFPGNILLTGSEPEKEICHKIETEVKMGDRIKNLAGQLSLIELAALFREASLLISGDTGPYHIAMAVNTPTVTLFAPWDIGSSPEINGPYFNRDRHMVVQTEKIGDSIETIKMEQVFESCKCFLGGVLKTTNK